MRGWAKLLLLVPVIGTGMGMWMTRASPRSPLQTAFWFWHHPFRLEREADLHDAGVQRLYVHAGTVAAGRGGKLRLTSRQEWLASPHTEPAAVVRVDPPANRALLEAPEAEIRRLIDALELPERVRTLQWDVDVPTRSLPDYARFLERARSAAPAGFRTGATALPDWIRSPGYRRLCDALDEISPQFYGNRIPQAGQAPPPLWETRNLADLARRAAAGRASVWIGLPAYGRCVVMDPDRRPAAYRHDLNPDELLEDPAWERVLAQTRREGGTAVEDTVVFRSRTAETGHGLPSGEGVHLWFQWPRAEGLRAWVQANRAALPERVAGVCYFRWPAPGEPPAAPLGPSPTEPALELRGGGNAVRARVTTGTDTPAAEGGVELTLRPADGEVRSNERGQWLRDGEPVSRLRGEEVRFTRPFLRPGSTWEPVEVLQPAGPVTATLRWQAGDGKWREKRSAWGGAR